MRSVSDGKHSNGWRVKVASDPDDYEEDEAEVAANEAWDALSATTLERHCQMLMEFFDSVQIVVTKDERNCTRSASFGGGNMFARMGSVRSWLENV